MWLFTDRGFFSAVEAEEDPNKLVIRARVRGDLEALLAIVTEIEEPPQIIEGGGTDYPYRVVLSRRAFGFAAVQLVEFIDYENFKDAVEDKQGERRHDVYLRVWSAVKALDWVRGGRKAVKGQGQRRAPRRSRR